MTNLDAFLTFKSVVFANEKFTLVQFPELIEPEPVLISRTQPNWGQLQGGRLWPRSTF